MATCADCAHVEVCKTWDSSGEIQKDNYKIFQNCPHFKDRSRFLELPCKVGDTAWIIVRYKNGNGHFYTGIVTGVHVTDRKTIYKLPCKRFNYIVIRFLQTDSLKHINFNEIGKTVFFTKEQAEQALKERENNG